jgi:hypothetical protein
VNPEVSIIGRVIMGQIGSKNDGFEVCLRMQLRRHWARKKTVFCQFSTGIGNFGAVKGTDQSEAFFIHPNLTVTISTSSIIIRRSYIWFIYRRPIEQKWHCFKVNLIFLRLVSVSRNCGSLT